MKTIFALLLFTTCSTASAQLYIAVSYGQTTFSKTPCPKENFSCEPRVVGWKAALGYRANKHLYLEAQWVDLGRANRYAMPNVSAFELGRKGARSFATARGPAVMALFSWPVTERFSAYLGGGVHALKVRNSVMGRPNQAYFDAQGILPSHTEGTSLGPVWSIGGQYDFTKRWGARAEFSHYNRVGGSTIGGLTGKDLAAISIVYKMVAQ